MYFEETKKVNEFFKYAIAIVLIAGIIAGIGAGIALREPTASASYAKLKLSTGDYIPSSERAELLEQSREGNWTGTGVGVMLGTWVTSAIAALLLYAKNRQIIMLDMIAFTVAGKREDEPVEEEAPDAERETAEE